MDSRIADPLTPPPGSDVPPTEKTFHDEWNEDRAKATLCSFVRRCSPQTLRALLAFVAAMPEGELIHEDLDLLVRNER